MSSASLPQPGDIIAGKYVVERKLGEGGMGAVFAARNTRVNKAYALKVMLPEATGEESRKRFENEALNAGGLSSDHIAQVIDSGSEGGLYYMVLELLDGRDLAQLGEEIHGAGKKIEPHVAVGWMLQALEGVRVAHAARIIHRDLKPSNLFLAKKSDGSEIIKVLDFGISKAQGDSPFGQAVSSLTSTKAMLGSPLYVAPEQVRSSKGVDARTDIWAIGVILYELLAGVPPFMGEHLGELFAQIIEEPPTSLMVRAPAVSPQLAAIVMRCLAKRPDDRFQTAQELISALRPFSHPMLVGTVAMGVASPFATSGYAPPPGLGNLGVTTGSSVHPPVVKGAPGALTPQPGEWQSTTGGSAAARKSNTLIAAGVAVAAALLVGGVGLAAAGRFWFSTRGSPPRTGSALPPPPVASAPAPEPPASTAAAPAPSAPATAASSVAVVPTPPPKGQGHAPAYAKPGAPEPKPLAAASPVDPPKVDPPFVDPPKTSPPKTSPPNVDPPKPPPKPTGRPAETSR